MPKDRILVAKIGAAHGIRGEVKMLVFADDPMAIGRYGPLEDERGRRFRIRAVRPGKSQVIAQLDGVSDRNAAERLRGLELYIARDRLPKQPDRNSFYQADLIGLAVRGSDGSALGRVTSVQNFGAGDLIEIAPADGGERVLVPFVDKYVPVVDLEEGCMVIDPPAGLFAARPSRGRSNDERRRGRARRRARSRAWQGGPR